MAEEITAREANHNFSKLLREVERGAEYVVTRNGVPVARIVSAHPRGERVLTAAQEEVLARSMARLRRGWRLGGDRLDRDALHDR
jgi:prevent-host-death family protein